MKCRSSVLFAHILERPTRLIKLNNCSLEVLNQFLWECCEFPRKWKDVKRSCERSPKVLSEHMPKGTPERKNCKLHTCERKFKTLSQFPLIALSLLLFCSPLLPAITSTLSWEIFCFPEQEVFGELNTYFFLSLLSLYLSLSCTVFTSTICKMGK